MQYWTKWILYYCKMSMSLCKQKIEGYILNVMCFGYQIDKGRVVMAKCWLSTCQTSESHRKWAFVHSFCTLSWFHELHGKNHLLLVVNSLTESLTVTHRERALSSSSMCYTLFLIVEAMWPAAWNSCHHEFHSMMNSTLEFQARIHFSPLETMTSDLPKMPPS